MEMRPLWAIVTDFVFSNIQYSYTPVIVDYYQPPKSYDGISKIIKSNKLIM